MASLKSLEYSIERAIKYYSSLFVLPSYRRIALFTFLLCLGGGIFAVFLLLRASIILAIQFGLLLFSLSTISDLLIRQVLMRSDPVYNSRRCAALSMFSILLWFGFLIIGSLLTRISNFSWIFWIDLFLIGFGAICILRMIVLFSTSFPSFWRMVTSSLVQPIACLLPMYYVPLYLTYSLDLISLVYFVFAIPITIFIASLFVNQVNNVGMKALHTPTTRILRAFLANWMENLNIPIETLFERFGLEKTINFSLLAFKAKNRIKSVIVIPAFHPGPFKNVGSSLLPFIIQEALEKKFNCVAAVPHGLFGHEFDLSSQKQNQKVLRKILSSTDFSQTSSKATCFIRTQIGVASASCQKLGDCAVLILTLAPETTEDFPQEVGDFILEKASQLGFKHAIIINAHNSIDSPFNMNDAVEPLKVAAFDVLEKSSKLKPHPFHVGVAKVSPKEFSLEDGMGLGGIHVLVVKVSEQTSAYVTIDGNNMISGLREKILDSIKELGIEIGEVLTTDTHAVNAITTTTRGYHPLGETIPHETLNNHILSGIKDALNNMEPASTAWQTGEAANVKVIGEGQIKELSWLADKALRKAKNIAAPLFTVAGLLLITLLIIF
ncbi:MAG: DUF2070 family protein [Candidatus Bathyarchaeota archaeon]|nr:MAG: DUF2070 family protein [Candidatus Bathyarchaeota archaeon]